MSGPASEADPGWSGPAGEYVECDSDQRYGPTLRSVTAAAAAAELAAIVYPPQHVDWSLIDRYLGLADPATPPINVDEIRGTSRTRVLHLAERLRTVGRTVRLRPELWPRVSVADADSIDNARRARTAFILCLPPPVSPYAQPAWYTPRVALHARIGVRVLATAGPLYLDDLADAIADSHPAGGGVGADHLAAALLILGAHLEDSDGRWRHTAAADHRDVALIAAARATGRRRHTSAQAAALLVQAGFRPGGVISRIRRHPLIHRVTHNQYRILGT